MTAVGVIFIQGKQKFKLLGHTEWVGLARDATGQFSKG